MPQQSDFRLLVEEFLRVSKNPLIVVLGPTASGKTGFSIRLTHRIASFLGRNAEIVNADSRQLYRHLDIGTAKITEEEMEGVPHHLIDVLDPKEEASAGRYQSEALRHVAGIRKRGNIPLLVGGSMLYISAVIDGLTMAPEADAAVRERLLQEYDRDQGASLHRRLTEIDPESAQGIHPNNKPRLIRAVEIFELTHQPKSSAVPRDELRPTEKIPSKDLLIFGIERPREELYERINMRTKEMFSCGWIAEVQDLLDRGYGHDDPGMKSHGYREIMEAILSGEPINESELAESIAAQSRHYARRQLSWWRNDLRIRWITQSPALYRETAPSRS